MKIGTTKEYNELLRAACEMANVVRFYCGTDELCRRKVLEAMLELNIVVDKWDKSIDELESDTE